jgi:ElaB/YqjD/DUF883 family membrane-anchored ribosome-binding protein
MAATAEKDLPKAAEKDFQKDLDAVRADLSALTETLGKFVTIATTAEGAIGKAAKQAGKKVGANASDLMEEGAQLASDSAKAAMDGVAAGAASLEQHIKQNPVNAVLIALGVGFLVGIIGHR